MEYFPYGDYRQRLIYGVVAGLKVRFPSPYATKIGKFIEFFYLLFALENSMNFPVQIRLNIEVGENPAMRYI